MNEETFQRKLAELVAEIGTLPASEREKLQLLAEQTALFVLLFNEHQHGIFQRGF